MRLTIPAPNITLYDDTFDTHDLLDRRQEGAQLSDLVERITAPMVIAVDGPWGCGKSVFLKLWVGHHTKHAKNTAKTVYFDAFEHDFLDDPLVALTATIAREVEATDDAARKAKVKRLKTAAWTIGKASLRVGANILTFGAIEHLGDLGDAIANYVNDEAQTALKRKPEQAAATFWDAQYARMDAMETFREALVELTEPDDEGAPTCKLVVVVDELDRCRPDFALNLLEVIKHFFAVDGVHFVLGVNLTELENSVRARYGDRSAAGKYLEKFYTLRFKLTSHLPTGDVMAAKHFSNAFAQNSSTFSRIVEDYIKRLKNPFAVNLRDVERIYTHCQVVPHQQTTWGEDHLLAGLIVANSIHTKFVERARQGSLKDADVLELFEFGDESFDTTALSSWRLALGAEQRHVAVNGQERDRKTLRAMATLFHRKPLETVLQDTIVNYFDVFQLPDHL